MYQPDPPQPLPSAAGSPFKSKNFAKSFFGIMIAAILLANCILAYFLLLGRHQGWVSALPGALLPSHPITSHSSIRSSV